MHGLKKFLVPIILFLTLLTIYFFTSSGPTPYDYFSRLADSFLKGRYWLTEQPSWLTELIPASGRGFYVVYPPMPAILLMLPRFIWKSLFEQQYLAHIMGAGIALGTYLFTLKITGNRLKAVWSFLLIGLGSIVWYLSATGSSWYLGQVSACFFLIFAIYESVTNKRPFVLGLLVGAAFLSRINTFVSALFFIFILSDRKWFKNYFYFGLGVMPFVILNFIYNYVRFATIFDQAYFLLPKVLNETTAPWFINGVVNINYIPNNIRVMFWSLPKRISEFPYIIPSWGGLAIWITTPAFIYALFTNYKQKIIWVTWLTILLIFAIVASHGGTGWAQFGYRFAVDFYPFLMFLIAKHLARYNLKWHYWLLLFFSVIVNLWGVILINKLGLITF